MSTQAPAPRALPRRRQLGLHERGQLIRRGQLGAHQAGLQPAQPQPRAALRAGRPLPARGGVGLVLLAVSHARRGVCLAKGVGGGGALFLQQCTMQCKMHMHDAMHDAHLLYYAHTHSLCTCTMRCTMRCTVQQVRLRKSGLGSDAASASACGFVPGEGLRCAGAEQGKAKQARQWEGTCVTAAAWLESAPQLLKWTTMTASTTKVSQPYMCERLQPCVEVAALCVHPGLQGRPCVYHQGAPWRLGRRTQRDVRRRPPARRRGGRWRGALRPLERLPQPHSRGLRR